MLRHLLNELLIRLPWGLTIAVLCYAFDPVTGRSLMALMALTIGFTVLLWYGALLRTLWQYHRPIETSSRKNLVVLHPRLHG